MNWQPSFANTEAKGSPDIQKLSCSNKLQYLLFIPVTYLLIIGYHLSIKYNYRCKFPINYQLASIISRPCAHTHVTEIAQLVIILSCPCEGLNSPRPCTAMMIMMAFPMREVNAANYPYCYHVTRSPDNRRRRGFHCKIVATNAAQNTANISIMTPLKAIGTGREFKMSRVHFFVSIRAGRKSRPSNEGPGRSGFLGYKNLALFP